jgi:HD superfamily phosphohydrolase
MKRYYDSVHGFIHVSDEEKELFDHPAFVRLNYLHQLGVTYLVYPGATHSRFEHSLGVMHIATKMYDHLFEKKDPVIRQALRIGAISHDLGHLPFSHTLESTLLKNSGHEIQTLKILESLKDEPFFINQEQSYPGFMKLCMKLAVSPQYYREYFPGADYSQAELVLSSLISGDYFGADRIDYLVRDSKSTGVSVGLFDYPQLIEMLTLANVDGLTIALKEEGLHAAEGLLLARHYMHARVYQHETVLFYNHALKEFVKAENIEPLDILTANAYIQLTDATLTDRFMKASFDTSSKGHTWAQYLTKQKAKPKGLSHQVKVKTPGPLLVLTKEGELEIKHPTPLEKIFF